MKNRLRWFVHDIIVAATWVGIFVTYYTARAFGWLAELWRGNDERR